MTMSATDDIYGGEGPYLPVPAGLLNNATKQLDVFAALLDPFSSCLRTHLRAVLAARGLHDPSNAILWIRTTTEPTSLNLAHCLNDTGIIIDDSWPHLNRRTRR